MYERKRTVDGVKEVLMEYAEGTYTGNEEKLRSVFHKDAVMSGYLEEEQLITTPEAFILDVMSKKTMKESNSPYEPELLEVSMTGNIATAVMKETGFWGKLCFENYFHLIFDKEWKIISKLFTTIDE